MTGMRGPVSLVPRGPPRRRHRQCFRIGFQVTLVVPAIVAAIVVLRSCSRDSLLAPRSAATADRLGRGQALTAG